MDGSRARRRQWRWRRRALGVLAATLVVLFGPIGTRPAFVQNTNPLETLLVYDGAFRVPAGGDERATFDYGGTAIAFDTVRRSLWLVGHDHHQLTAEISVPDVRRDVQTIDDLATATLLTPFRDVLQGRMSAIGDGTSKIGGLLRDGSDWIVTAWLYYDAAGAQTLSHFRVGQAGNVSGPFQIGPDPRQAGFVSGYMTDVPPEWRTRLGGAALTGLCCVSIISRSSFGPAATAFEPRDVGRRSPVPVTHLLGYPSAHPTLGEWSSNSPLFNGNTQIGGLAFPVGSDRVIFFGRVGLGAFCYGTGTSSPGLHGRQSPDGSTYCYDPEVAAQGTHGYPYALHVWIYDANDLAEVVAGRKARWDIRPQGAGVVTVPFERGQRIVGGAAYDPATQRIFVSVLAQDDARPLIHVLRFTSNAPTDPPVRPDVPSPGGSRPWNNPAAGHAIPR
jgi:hypothetical protein